MSRLFVLCAVVLLTALATAAAQKATIQVCALSACTAGSCCQEVVALRLSWLRY